MPFDKQIGQIIITFVSTELVIAVEDLTKPIIDAYSTDQTVTHEVQKNGPVIVIRNPDTIAAIEVTSGINKTSSQS
jgi:hypothetical protein